MKTRISSKISRRGFLRHGTAIGGLAASLALISACHQGEPSVATTTPATTARPNPSPPTISPVIPTTTTASAPSTASGQPTPANTSAAVSGLLLHGSGTVDVMYAGSLVTLMEKHLGTAFDEATGFHFRGEGKGSVAIANLIKGKARTPDIFISADPSVNSLLEGRANGDYVSWWVPFARTTMVVAWSPRSKFASAFGDAKAGKRTWESVLKEPGFRLGRTDPELDPKGYRTLWLFQLDEKRTGQKGEALSILGQADNPNQIFPEEQLVARLQSGELDAGIFYLIEAVEAGLPYLELPSEVNQGDPAQVSTYATVRYTDKKGKVYTGTPILYTVTIPATARNVPGATAFVQYLLSDNGQKLMSEEGLLPSPPVVSGDVSALPPMLKSLVKAQ